MLNSICNFEFIVSLCTASKLLGHTYNLSEYLQKKQMDLVSALSQVQSITSLFTEMRENAEERFESLYKEAKAISERLNVEECVPRTCAIQRNRENIPYNNAEEYYRRAIFIPFLEDLISSLKERFETHRDSVKSLQNVLPTKTIDKTFDAIEDAVAFYADDLPGFKEVVEAEWELWKRKWAAVDVTSRPSTTMDALASCEKNIFPNIYELLKILAILPVSIATAERSFSTLRRLKTYLRSTMSETRLNGLALLSIHRDINIPDETVIGEFVNSGKARKLNFLL